MFSTLVLLVVLAVSITSRAELQVTVTNGVEDCSDEDRAAPGMLLKMHYTGSIDESSSTG